MCCLQVEFGSGRPGCSPSCEQFPGTAADACGAGGMPGRPVRPHGARDLG